MSNDETPEEKFDRLFTFEQSAFRLETLPTYKVGENSRFKRYKAGKPIEDMNSQSWCNSLREWTSADKSIHRVRLIPKNRGAYFNFEVEACYPHNVASGEEIYMLEEKAFNEQLDLAKEDVWVLDGENILQMEYADDGEFVDCFYREDSGDKFLDATSKLISTATEFTRYLRQRRRREI